MLRFLTAGEAHGQALTIIIEGLPAGLKIELEEINEDLREFQIEYGSQKWPQTRGSTSGRGSTSVGGSTSGGCDKATITSGLRKNLTLGSPLCLTIANKDWKNWRGVMAVTAAEATSDWEETMVAPRPGQADLAGAIKYGHQDLRNVLECAGACQIAVRVAAGAVAKILLREFEILLLNHTVEIKGIKADPEKKSFEQIKERAAISLLRCADKKVEAEMIKAIDEAKKVGGCIGGVFEVRAVNLPIGLGSYVHWDRRLDGRLARAVMSIPGVKGVEFGLGFEAAKKFSSQVHDAIFYSQRRGFYRQTNNAGGLEGGLTNGQPLHLRAAVEPGPPLHQSLTSVDFQTKQECPASYERADICAVPAVSVVGEAVVAIELCRAMQEKFGGDSLNEMKNNYQNYQSQVDRL